MSSLLIKNIAEIFTGIKSIPGDSVLIEDGIITQIGHIHPPWADLVLDAEGKTLTPGFIDCHTHLVFAGSREFELDMKLKGATYTDIARVGGINYTVNLTQKTSKKELFLQAYKRLDAMLAHGTTTLEAKSGYGLDIATEIKILEVVKELNKKHPLDIIPTFMGAHAIPPGSTRSDYQRDILDDMIPVVTQKKLAKFCDVFCEKGYFTLEQSQEILEMGKKCGLAPKIHADELTPYGGAELAAKVQATSADHLLCVSDRGIQEMITADVTAVLLPTTPFSLMESRYAPARKMIQQGLRVALATDLNPNCWTESMQFVIQLACYMMHMTPQEAIEAATRNAAYALGISDTIGTIEIGKKADLLLLDCPSHCFLPYHFGVNLVSHVIKNGEIIYPP
jgi:imidazolonepropionase